ncbi:MAG: Ig-like domain-containing protein, partial [Deltaproteobacteria bacterium]|nr:Ig-like domain-containing protein [Deltaproteobacteria bacterium]
AIAAVDASGLVTAVAPGTATITATDPGGVATAGTTTVTVEAISITALTDITPNPGTVPAGQDLVLTANGATNLADPDDVSLLVTWTSGDDLIATVSVDGVVTGVAEGLVTITASADIGGTLTEVTTDVTVTAAVTAITFVVIGPPTTIGVGQTVTAVALGDTTADTGVDVGAWVTWSSSDETVATVDPDTGVITAVAIGTADIIATPRKNNAIVSPAQATVTVALVDEGTDLARIPIPTDAITAVDATSTQDGQVGTGTSFYELNPNTNLAGDQYEVKITNMTDDVNLVVYNKLANGTPVAGCGTNTGITDEICTVTVANGAKGFAFDVIGGGTASGATFTIIVTRKL